MDMGLVIDQRSFGDPVVQALVAELQQEFEVRYGGPDETPLDITMFDPPAGAFFLGTLGSAPVAMGGWRLRPDVAALGRSVAAEIKRMYVVPTARGRGWARAVLAALESSAGSFGADVMVLETGLKQPEAIALYESSGYVPVEGFGYYKDSPIVRYFGKPL
ncbi:MAG TPA: GNAT family N-acetyltransferase [Marmoricola sp.]|nr:GNAT family N-acetyltransferase [Marmoricola sp.]